MQETKSTPIDWESFVVHSVIPTEKYYKKVDQRTGKLINKHPNCFVVHGFYEGNPNYCTIVSAEDAKKLKSVSQKAFNELLQEVKRLGEVVASMQKGK